VYFFFESIFLHGKHRKHTVEFQEFLNAKFLYEFGVRIIWYQFLLQIFVIEEKSLY
jgi:hypothetical protein